VKPKPQPFAARASLGDEELVIGRFDIPGPGDYRFSFASADLPVGPALLGYFAKDVNGMVAGEHVEVLIGGFSNVDFAASPIQGTAPLTVDFTNLTAPVDSVTGWEWDFEFDGIVDSSEENPTFTYSNAGTYTVWLNAVNPHGNDAELKLDFITVTGPTGVDEGAASPRVNRLIGVSPSPFGAGAQIRFTIAQSSPVRIDIYDVQGRWVRSVVDVVLEGGEHSISWNGTDDSGRQVPSGFYYVTMKAGDFEQQHRVLRLR
jgi:PKD repeat protein